MKFAEIDFHPILRKALDDLKFVECTPIQEKTMPYIMAGRDVAGLAQTGTGKTGAFLLPIMNRILLAQDQAESAPVGESDSSGEGSELDDESKAKEASNEESSSSEPSDSSEEEKVQFMSDEEKAKVPPLVTKPFESWQKNHFILVLVPTRELCEQVYQSFMNFRGTSDLKGVSIYGGVSYDSQKEGLKEGAQFVIATPGRLIDLYKEHLVDLRQVRAIAFDEADRMFDMGFKDDMKYILKRIPEERQFLVFSATLNFDVLNTAYQFNADPVEINVSKDQPKAENVADEIFHIGHEEKPAYLLSLLKKHEPKQTIIFSNFKFGVTRIAKFLSSNGYPAAGISSLLTQAQRNRVMEQFKAENQKNILVATDVAARGLDIKGVDMVFNYELPDDPENYVHRIGRTGRAGEKGLAFSLVSDRDVDALGRIEEYLKHKIEMGWLDESDIEKDFKDFPKDEPRRRSEKPRSGDRGRGSSDRGGYKGKRRSDGDSKSRDGGRDRERDRDRKDGERGDKRRRPDRKRSEESGSKSRPARRRSGDESESVHRDRASGRHKTQGQKGGRRAADQQETMKATSKRKRPNNKRRNDKRRPNSKRPTEKSQSLGQKIGGFFKKLFS